MADPSRSGDSDDPSPDADVASDREDASPSDPGATESGVARGASSSGRSGTGTQSGTATGEGPRERRVEVPSHVYKRVTVFSTLFAVLAVVAGFVILDEATDRATASVSEIDPVLALFGVGLIVAGAVTYAFSTRFQAEGMGNAKDESDERSNNG